MAFKGGFGFGRGIGLGFGLGKGKGLPGFVEEDRSHDWYCPKCRERNFVKRLACFKCSSPKPKDGENLGPKNPMPAPGSTLNGMVKSYNKKGFGFIMCFGMDEGQDIYYTRENVSPRLLHPDMPGEQVTFELQREGGRLVAKNIRPLGEERNAQYMNGGKAGGKVPGHVFGPKAGGKMDEEDRSRDWGCSSCGERNFVKRFECFRCKMPRATGFTDAPSSFEPPKPPEQKRTFSPHAGSRAVREALAAERRPVDPSSSSSRKPRKKKKGKKRKRSTSSSDSVSDSSDGKKKKSRRKGSSSSRGRRRSSSSDCQMEEPSAASSGAAATAAQPVGDPDIEKAKSEALQALIKLKSVEPKDARMKEYRSLLRQWHPDKNPERVEVATAVFQFLQKGKPMLDP